MKSQATVHSIKRKPNAPGTPTAHQLTITIDNHGVPRLAPGQDNTPVATGDTVTWTCTPGIAGTLSLYFDPFHAVPLFTGPGNPGSPIPIPTYTVGAEQPPQGQQGKSFHYHMSWTDAVHGTHGHDPVIIVDPTNVPKK
jgi:hypothetical protein